MRKTVFLATAILARCLFGGAFTVVSPGGATADYDTLAAARNACVQGGETIVFNQDVAESIGANFTIAVPNLTIDLNSHTLTIPAGQFFQPLNGADGLTFANGSIVSGETLLFLQGGSENVGTITFRDCRVDAVCIAYASYGTVDMYDSTVCGRLVLSQGCASGFTFNAYDCVLAPFQSATDGAGGIATGASANFFGGYSNFDPQAWVPAGYAAIAESHTVDGCACTYAVYREGSVPDTVQLISSDGTATNGYTSLGAAVSALAGGETLRLLVDIDIVEAISISHPAVTFDLDGHTLAKRVAGDFFVLDNNASGFTLRNGSAYTYNSLFNTVCAVSGLGEVYLEDLSITGQCVIYGTYGTFHLAGVVAATDYFVSQGCSAQVAVCFESGVVAPAISPTDNQQNTMYTPANVSVSGGSFTFDPSAWLADGCYAEAVQETVSGIACSYSVFSAGGDLDVASVVSSDGAAEIGYTTFAAAMESIRPGETLKLLRNWTVADDDYTLALDFGVSITVDLNGFTLSNTSGNFITLSSGAEVAFVNGSISQQNAGSVFILQNPGCSVVVSNCTVRGYCLVWGDQAGSVSLADSDTVLSYTASCNGNTTLDISGGAHYMSAFHDGAAGAATGTAICIAGGRYRLNPFSDPLVSVADGYCVKREDYSAGVLSYGYSVIASGNLSDCEARIGAMHYGTLEGAVAEALDGDSVVLLKNRSSAVRIASPADLSNVRRIALDLGGNTISAGGSMFWIEPGYAFSVSNGSFRATAGMSEVFVLFSDLSVDSSVSFARDAGVEGSLVNIPSGDISVYIDGADIDIGHLFNANWSGTLARFTGETVYRGGSILYPQSPVPQSGALEISGGWWAADPSQYVTAQDLRVRDYGENYAGAGKVLRYRVEGATDGFIVIVK
ncbi:MAG: hypothetical protein ILO34_04550 [Kiritimatiellae bacterium]|nr:hypothetical protein [Kiritimatiellia bacterium]